MTTRPDLPDTTPQSRRRLLGRLSAAAVGGGALAATGLVGGGRAAADTGDSLELGEYNQADQVTLLDTSGANGLTVFAVDPGYAAVRAIGSIGVWAVTNADAAPRAAVYGEVTPAASQGVGVIGVAPTNTVNGTGVEGIGYKGIGVRGTVTDSGYGVIGEAGVGFGVKGEASKSSGIGVAGSCANGGTGVRGTVPNFGYGVRGKAGAGFGVLGEVTTGVGVSGESSDNGWGVRGKAFNGGWGVQGTSDTSFGVRGDSTGGTGVRGESQTDIGVYGRSIFHTDVTGYGAIYGVQGQCDPGSTAVIGTSSAGGYGVRGETDTGVGVAGRADKGVAISGEGRWGGQFKGTRAAVRLVPTASAGAPTSGSHLRGELVCDKDGHLWFCTADGTPGTWAQIV